LGTKKVVSSTIRLHWTLPITTKAKGPVVKYVLLLSGTRSKRCQMLFP
jgi:hypothetical protein